MAIIELHGVKGFYLKQKEVLIHSMAGEIFQGCSKAQVSKMLNHNLDKQMNGGLWSTEMDHPLEIFGWDSEYNYMEEQW